MASTEAAAPQLQGKKEEEKRGGDGRDGVGEKWETVKTVDSCIEEEGA